MARCAGTTRKGGQCTAIVKPPLEYCYAHDPAREGERRRNASKAGSAKPSREILALKGELKALITGVLSGSVERGEASVCVQAYNSLARLIEVERRMREQDELEERIAALEEAEGRTKGGREWGA